MSAANDHARPVGGRPRMGAGTTAGGWRRGLWPALLVAGLTAAITFILAFQFLPSQVQINEGEVAKQNVRAPQKVTYVSQIKTKEAREAAVQGIADVYDYDPGLAQQQKSKVMAACQAITAIRNNLFITDTQKRDRLAQMTDPQLTDKAMSDTLAISGTALDAACAESIRVVEEVMREHVRLGQLADVQAKIATRFGPSLPPAAVALATELSNDYLKVNETLNADETNQRKRDALAAVQPVRFTVEKNEIVVREGNVVTALDLEKLEALGLRGAALSWPDLLATLCLVAVLVVALSLYLSQFQPNIWLGDRRTVLLALLIILTVLVTKGALPGRAGLIYLFPFAAVPLLVALLVDTQLALVVAVFLSVLAGTVAENSLEIATFSLVGGAVGVLSLRRVERLSAFLWAGLYVALANYAVILAFHLGTGDYDSASLALLAGTSLANGGIAAAISATAVIPLGYLFGITTLVQLLELAHPSQPLFRKLLVDAPGTYHHSVIVASLAERGAAAIGDDTLLARVASYYHDVGKATHPYYFIENQVEGINVHDGMDPVDSAEAIIAHVTEGAALAKRYRLPQEVADVIQQHHGTRLTLFFYDKAAKAAAADGAELLSGPFRYPGPKPQSRLAALVMLADGVEATVRSEPDHSPERLEQLVRQVVDERLPDQLDESGLTLRDLEAIKLAFTGVLQGVYHPRLQYPPALPSPLPGS